MQFRTVFGTDSSLALGMTFLVTIDGTAGGVKDLKHHTIFLHQILHFVQNDREGVLYQILRFPPLDSARVLRMIVRASVSDPSLRSG